MKAVFVFTAALFAASSAWAQSAQNPPAPTNGPLVLERIHDPWVLAPDFKVTDLDDRTGELAGAYGGRLLDNTLLIGGAVYWLANDERDFKMTYGGVLVGWQSREFGRIRFGAPRACRTRARRTRVRCRGVARGRNTAGRGHRRARRHPLRGHCPPHNDSDSRRSTAADSPAPCRHRGLLHRRATGEHLVPTD